MEEVRKVVDLIVSKGTTYSQVRNKHWSDQDLWIEIHEIQKHGKIGSLQSELKAKGIVLEIDPWDSDPCYTSPEDGDIFIIRKEGYEDPNIRINKKLGRESVRCIRF